MAEMDDRAAVNSMKKGISFCGYTDTWWKPTQNKLMSKT